MIQLVILSETVCQAHMNRYNGWAIASTKAAKSFS